MASDKENNFNELHGVAQFVLFVTSYIPLFVLICLKQISKNIDYLNWGGVSWLSSFTFLQKFGLSTFFILVSLFGLWGCIRIFANLKKDVNNGENVVVTDVKNKNNESIGYIATYIVPFLFQNFDTWYECIALLFLLIIIYRIYINSNLLLINPLLSFKYSIFEIEFDIKGKKRNGLVIVESKFIQEDTTIKIYEIGPKLYYAIKRNPQNL